jgi:hypothetical protein
MKSEIWVADSETDPFELGLIPEPFIWGLYNGTDYYEFTNTSKFVSFVSRRDIILYAHNGGKFDWHFLSPFFEPDNPILVIAGRLSRFNIGACEFRDSINIYNKPLAAFQKEEFDYNKMDKANRAEFMPEIKKYLRSDCENLYNLVMGFINEYGLHITTASAAMKFWQLRLKNKVPRSDEYFYNDFKRFYFGGRVQCFISGDHKVQAQSADINSAYPAAMLSDHPYGLHYTQSEGKPDISPENWGPMFFDIECIAHGAFCYRGTNGTLYYPDDDIARIYHVTGWELLAAIDTNTAEKIKFLEWYQFHELKNFSEYINEFWQRRKDFKASGDKHGGDFAKLMMNSLYGKFAANPLKYKNNILADKKDFYENGIYELEDGETWKDFREWVVISKNQDKKSKRFYNLATAASITGYVRAKLWTAICDCDTPMYCDTDSITAKGFGKRVRISDKLGDWGIEHYYNRVIVCGKKLYAMRKKGRLAENEKRWKIASKGARLTAEQIIRVAAGKPVTYRNIAPTFSVAKSEPTFLAREIKATAGDSRIIPRRFDPLYEGEKE